MKLYYTFIFLLFSSIDLLAQNSNIIPYRKGDLWGYCDSNKNEILPYIYDEVEAPSVERFLWINKNSVFGIFDIIEKRIVLEPNFESIIVCKKIFITSHKGYISTFNFKGELLQNIGWQEIITSCHQFFNTSNGTYYTLDDSSYKFTNYPNFTGNTYFKNNLYYRVKTDANTIRLIDTTPYISIENIGNYSNFDNYYIVEDTNHSIYIIDTLGNKNNKLSNLIKNIKFEYNKYPRSGYGSYYTISDKKSIEKYLNYIQSYKNYSGNRNKLENTKYIIKHSISKLEFYDQDDRDRDRYRNNDESEHYLINGWSINNNKKYVYIKYLDTIINTNFTQEMIKGSYRFLYNKGSNVGSLYRYEKLIVENFNFFSFLNNIQFYNNEELSWNNFYFNAPLLWCKDSTSPKFYLKSVFGDSTKNYENKDLFSKIVFYDTFISGYKNSSIYISTTQKFSIKTKDKTIILNVFGDTVVKLSNHTSKITYIRYYQNSLYNYAIYDSLNNEYTYFNPFPIRTKKVKGYDKLIMLLDGKYYKIYQNVKKDYHYHKVYLVDSNFKIVYKYKQKKSYNSYYGDANFGDNYSNSVHSENYPNCDFKNYYCYLEKEKKLIIIKNDGKLIVLKNIKYNWNYCTNNDSCSFAFMSSKKIFIQNSNYREISINQKFDNFYLLYSSLNYVFLLDKKDKTYLYNENFELIKEFKKDDVRIKDNRNGLFYIEKRNSETNDYEIEYYFDSKGTIYYEP